MNPRTDVAWAGGRFRRVDVDRVGSASPDVDGSNAERCADPLMKVDANEIRAEIRQEEI